jgi:lipoprotein NlpI
MARRWFRPVTLAVACLSGLEHSSLPGAEPTAPAGDSPTFLQKATEALRSGRGEEAVLWADRAVKTEPKSAGPYAARGRILAELGKGEEAVRDFNRALALDPAAAGLYQDRGSEQFKLGRIQESIADFDRYLKRVPSREPYHWQRGISYYYAGRFAEGRRQFELHQTVNPHDVENAVWHFLCVARQSGLDQARAALIPIAGDSRVPMKEVHQLFAGTVKPEAVLEAARSGHPSPLVLKRNQFYAHLYLGLYYEAVGDEAKTREHIFKAAELSEPQNYMGAVARVHAGLLRKGAPSSRVPKN